MARKRKVEPCPECQARRDGYYWSMLGFTFTGDERMLSLKMLLQSDPALYERVNEPSFERMH